MAANPTNPQALPSVSESVLDELRRLALVRSAKKKELDAIDQQIDQLIGLDKNERPKRKPLSDDTFRQLCGLQ